MQGTVVDYLLAKGLEINAVDASGTNAFMLASWAGNITLMDYFKQHGANMMALDKQGMNAYDYAKRNNQIIAMKWLKDNNVMNISPVAPINE